MGLKAISWVRFRAGLVQLGMARAGNATTTAMGPCLACGTARSANMAHIVVCHQFGALHRDLNDAYRQQGRPLPSDGWTRALAILHAYRIMLVDRIVFRHRLDASLNTCERTT